MRKISIHNLPDLPDFPEIPHRKEQKRHVWRWMFLLAVALAAIAWKTREAGGAAKRRSNNSAGSGTEAKTAATQVKSNEAVSPEASNSASVNREDEHSGESAPAATEDREPEVSSTGHSTIDAGEDEAGVFRPVRAEADAFGVVMTDDAPVGLKSETKWVDGDGSATCPENYPIKGNASSRIYHLPGESSYEKTIPELCFASEANAKAAGYRPRAR